MPLKSKRVTALVLASLSVAALISANRLMNRTDGQPVDARAAQKRAAAQQAKIAPALDGDVHRLIVDAEYGNVTGAKLRATFGFTVNDYVAEHPDQEHRFAQMLQAWAASNNFSSIEVVCVDIPPAMRRDPRTADIPIGLYLNGKCISHDNIGPHGLYSHGIPTLSKLYTVSMPMVAKQQHRKLY